MLLNSISKLWNRKKDDQKSFMEKQAVEGPPRSIFPLSDYISDKDWPGDYPPKGKEYYFSIVDHYLSPHYEGKETTILANSRPQHIVYYLYRAFRSAEKSITIFDELPYDIRGVKYFNEPNIIKFALKFLSKPTSSLSVLVKTYRRPNVADKVFDAINIFDHDTSQHFINQQLMLHPFLAAIKEAGDNDEIKGSVNILSLDINDIESGIVNTNFSIVDNRVIRTEIKERGEKLHENLTGLVQCSSTIRGEEIIDKVLDTMEENESKFQALYAKNLGATNGH